MALTNFERPASDVRTAEERGRSQGPHLVRGADALIEYLGATLGGAEIRDATAFGAVSDKSATRRPKSSMPFNRHGEVTPPDTGPDLLARGRLRARDRSPGKSGRPTKFAVARTFRNHS
jgi:hypothetical protein